MATLDGNLSLTLNGSTDFSIGFDEYVWSDRHLKALELWKPDDSGLATVKISLTGNNWGTNLIQAGGDLGVTLTDSAKGSGRFIATIRLDGAGDNVVKLARSDVQLLTTGNGNDTITTGRNWIGFIATGEGNDRVTTGNAGVMYIDLGEGDNFASIGAGGASSVRAGSGNDTITATGEIETLYSGRGNDQITTGVNYVDAINTGRGMDKVVLGSGGASFVALGRDADVLVVKQQADPTALVVVGGGGNISTPEDEDRDLVDFSAFTKSLTVDLSSGNATSAQGTFLLRDIEDVTGGRGADRLTGDGEDNALTGGGGRDTLTGGEGADMLRGNAGADRFVFTSVADSTEEFADTILDFSRKQGDRIDLSAIDANAAANGNQSFAFIGKKDFIEKAGQLRYETSGGKTEIQGDVDGDGAADLVILLNSALSLRAGDFILG